MQLQCHSPLLPPPMTFSVLRNCMPMERVSLHTPTVPVKLHNILETHHLNMLEILDQILCDPEAKQLILATLEQHSNEHSLTVANTTTESVLAPDPENKQLTESILPCDNANSNGVPAYEPSLLPFFLSDGIISPSNEHTDVWGPIISVTIGQPLHLCLRLQSYLNHPMCWYPLHLCWSKTPKARPSPCLIRCARSDAFAS